MGNLECKGCFSFQKENSEVLLNSSKDIKKSIQKEELNKKNISENEQKENIKTTDEKITQNNDTNNNIPKNHMLYSDKHLKIMKNSNKNIKVEEDSSFIDESGNVININPKEINNNNGTKIQESNKEEVIIKEEGEETQNNNDEEENQHQNNNNDLGNQQNFEEEGFEGKEEGEI